MKTHWGDNNTFIKANRTDVLKYIAESANYAEHHRTICRLAATTYFRLDCSDRHIRLLTALLWSWSNHQFYTPFSK